jgi:hypothetical protein
VYIYWYWQFFSLEAVHPTVVKYKYHLNTQIALNNPQVEYSGARGSITITVRNGTMPVADATVLVGISATYGGILNLTSNTLTTNSTGQAVWKYEVGNLSQFFVSCNALGNVVKEHFEEANLTVVANVSHALLTGSGTSTQSLLLINHPSAKYHLSVKATLNTPQAKQKGDKGSITFTVTNGTTPVANTVVVIGISSQYGGILNLTSNTLTTNSNGQAVWKYEVGNLSQSFLTTNSQGNLVNVFYEQADMTAVALANQNETGPGVASQNVSVVNPSLEVSYKLNASAYKVGENGSIMFKVTANGTAYSGANITISSSEFQNLSFNKTTITMTTSTNGTAMFSFKALKSGNITLSVQVNSSSRNHLVGANTSVVIPVTVAVKKVSTSSLDYIIIGVVIAVVVVAGAAAFVVMRKPKTKQ